MRTTNFMRSHNHNVISRKYFFNSSSFFFIFDGFIIFPVRMIYFSEGAILLAIWKSFSKSLSVIMFLYKDTYFKPGLNYMAACKIYRAIGSEILFLSNLSTERRLLWGSISHKNLRPSSLISLNFKKQKYLMRSNQPNLFHQKWFILRVLRLFV